MFPPFNQNEANFYCRKIITELKNGNIILKQISKPSEERENNGLMIGSLVCEEKKSHKKKVLFCVSGISRQLEIQKNPFDFEYEIVPPIASEKLINDALKKNDEEIHSLTKKIDEKKLNDEKKEFISKIILERTKLTDESLKKVFSLYDFTRFDGKKISLNEIIKNHNGHLPPTGTGDCCAPKLLSFAFSKNLQPLSMDEIFYGKNSKNKENLKSYPPCDERCGYILPSILGLKIIYADDDIVVVNKPSGLLSVPGRTEDKKDCVASRIKNLFPNCIEQPAVHRLDMETSGLMVLALKKETHADLNRQFEERIVKKEYVALLDGVLPKADGFSAPKNGEKQGQIELKFRLDIENRPHQIYDEKYGKLGITKWQLLNIENFKNPLTQKTRPVSRILFTPLTGRTHQLRLVSSDIHGFHLPIVGDTLYGKCENGDRLMLHCSLLSFLHPTTKKIMTFASKEPF